MRFVHLSALGGLIYLVAWSIQKATSFLGWTLDLTAKSGVGRIAVYLIGLACIYLFVTLAWRKPFGDPALRYWSNGKRVASGFFVMSALTSVGCLLIYSIYVLLGAATWFSVAFQKLDWSRGLKTILALGVATLLATTEEIIFRGFVFNYLQEGKPPTSGDAVIGSAVIFALVHNFQDPLAWFSLSGLALLTGLTLIGVMLASAYVATGSLACSAGLHAGMLWVKVLVRRIGLVQVLYPTYWWMGLHDDLRTAPIVWASFIVLTVTFWWGRQELRRVAAIEA